VSQRGEPLYKSRPTGPEAAKFGDGRRINDFISVSEGNSNTYLIETTEGHILINSGMGFEAPVHYANYAEVLGEKAGELEGNIRHLIFTQGHVDHVGGTQFFRDKNPEMTVVAQANNVEHQAYDARLTPFRSSRSAFRFIDEFSKVFSDYAAQGYSAFNAQDAPTADFLFEERHHFTLGGLEVELIAQMGAETNDSLIVWLPQHRICFTGNLFGCPFGHFPNLVTIRGDRYRDALTCAQAAQTVLDLKPDLILYGHHDPIEGEQLIQREVTAIRDAILSVHEATITGMNAGKSLHTLMQEIEVPADCEVGQGYGKVSWSVRAIWENYAGWFKHESTTELYSVPATAIHAELVELAGAQALIDRASSKLEAAEPEKALHLLDIVLGADPGNEAAKALSITVHQQLLEDAKTFCTTGNFWLVGWLQHQIKLLGGADQKSLDKLIK